MGIFPKGRRMDQAVSPWVPAAMAALFVAMAAPATPAFAQVPSVGVENFKAPPDPSWRARALQDVEAAYRFLQENHPGAAPELHDRAFIARLEAARATAMQRAKSVESAQGYNAVLAGLATDMGDKHIWSRPTLVVNLPYWTGAVIGKQGDSWFVVASDQAEGTPPEGARLVSCDGLAANELARRNLGGFRATWAVEAQQYQAAPWLLVDEGNPFVRRPESCVFETAQGQMALKLNWKRIKREDLLPKLKAGRGAGAAGFGIRKLGDGYWISLQDMTDKGASVSAEVASRQAELRSAPFVVVDVRGNGGGASDVGTRIARALWGPERTRAVTGPEDADCGDDFRASPGNLADMEYLIATLGAVIGPEGVAELRKQIVSGRDALTHGRSFARPPVCTKSQRIAAISPSPGASVAGPRVVLLTDNLCFSSCLVLTDQFRRLGALHVGRATDAATHFTEVREEFLPSGYSMFSTLQAVAPGEPAAVGPFQPARTYQSDIADTAAVEHWVLEQLGRPALSAPRRQSAQSASSTIGRRMSLSRRSSISG